MKEQYVYISYDENDIDSANEVLAYIEGRGVRCFIAPRDLNHDERRAKQIIEAIQDCSAAVVICSPFIAESESVLNEIDALVNARVTFFPLFVRSFELSPDLKYYLGRKQWVMASDGDVTSVLDKLGDALSACVHFPTPEERVKLAHNIPVYDGDDPYIFISYAHKDSERVLPIVAALAERGFRVWYDEGIKTGRVWADYIAERLEKSSCFIPLISKAFLDSDNCLEEISYAMDLKIPVLTSYIEDVVLKGGLRMRLGLKQGVFLYNYTTVDGFVDKLASAEEILPCLDASAAVLSDTAKRFKPLDLDDDEFLIENGVLKEYRGDGGVVNVPSGVMTVAEDAFLDCKNLEELHLPEGLTTLEPNAFVDCEGLRSISVPSTIESGVMLSMMNSNFEDIGFTSYKGGVYIGNDKSPYLVFCGIDTYEDDFELHPETRVIDAASLSDSVQGTELERISIPDGVRYIGYGAFDECKSLKRIVLPDSVKGIGIGAFSGCIALESIELSAGMTEISDSAFEDCSSLGSIDIPRGIKTIGERAFKGCKKLAEITVPEGVVEIGDDAFVQCCSLRRLSLPDSLERFSLSAISNDLMLDMEVYKNGEYLGNDNNHHAVLCSFNRDFDGNFEIAPTTKLIADEAFLEAFGMTSVSIPESVRAIGARAFADCTSLKEVDIPYRVKRIGDGAFSGCSSLEKANLPIAAETKDNVFPKNTKLSYI